METSRFGRFELLSRLGGGMGEVYLARSPGAARVQKTVVVKRMRQERMRDEAARARFVAEARVAVSLRHPHVVPVFEFGELDGSYFLVMEWVQGGDLAGIAGVDCPPLGWAAVALLGSQLCDALAYVHTRKDRSGAQLVHGDIAPKNVLLSRDGYALLADFGLARFAARGHGGTRRYLAPEQARGEPSDGRADLYSLALVLCEAATGAPAYDRDPDRAERQARVGLVPVLEACDPTLTEILRRALAPGCEDRFADAATMRDAFDAALDREPKARSSGRSELVGRIADRWKQRPNSQLEDRLDRTATATREATSALGRRWRWPVAAVALTGLAVMLAMRLWRPNAIGHPINPLNLPASAGRPDPEPFEAAATRTSSSPPTGGSTSSNPSIPASPSSPKVATAPSGSRVARRTAAPATAGEHPPGPRLPTANQEPASLDLNATPWAHVRIDGVERGETPLMGLLLSPGLHSFELANEPLGTRAAFRMALAPGAHTRKIVDLAPSLRASPGPSSGPARP